MLEGSDYLKLGLLTLFLALSAFFSGTETAFIALQRVRIIHLVRTGVPGSRRVFRMAQHPERLLSTVLLGNNLVNTAAAALGTVLVLSFMDNPTSAILVATAGIAFLLLIFGEILPKTFAARNAERFAFFAVRPLQAVEALLFPITRSLRLLSSALSRLTGGSGHHMLVTEQEIRSLISAGKEEGSVEPLEADMLEKVFHFGDRHVAEVMTPRPEIAWVENGATLRQFLTIYAENSHTQFPVFEESVDNVVGLLSVKDVTKALAENRIQEGNDVTHLLRPAHFVPETKTVRGLFNELRERGQSMAMIVDEFGGIAGLATLKQLLTVLVGPAREEDQPEEEQYASLDENTYLLDAGLSVLEINERLSLELPLGEYQTLAGFVLERLGRIPKDGEYLNHGDLRLTVREMDGVKVKRVEILRRAPITEKEAS
jgi:putative hemolysin